MTGFVTDPILGECFLIDHSSLEPITTCPYAAHLAIERKFKLNVAQPALRFGGHIHSALAYAYKMRYYTGQPPQELLTSGYTIAEKQHQLLARLFTSDPLECEDYRNLDTATKLIDAYNHWSLDEDSLFSVADLNGLPFVEKPFSILTERIDGHLVIYMGRIDMVVRDSKDHLYVFDHKTTSMLGEQFWSAQAMSGQYKGYCWAVRQAGLPIPTGYIVNALACRKPTKSGTPIDFERRTYYLKEDDLSLWYNNLLLQIETFLWHHKRQRYPQHTKHCVTKFGLCEFYSLCTQHPASHEDCLKLSPIH